MAISLEVKKFVNTEYVGKFAEIELPIAQPEDEEPPRKAKKKPDKKDKKEKKASFIRKRADYDGDDDDYDDIDSEIEAELDAEEEEERRKSRRGGLFGRKRAADDLDDELDDDEELDEEDEAARALARRKAAAQEARRVAAMFDDAPKASRTSQPVEAEEEEYQEPEPEGPRTERARIHYIEEGNGEPLILVHSVGQSFYTWRNMFSRLSLNYRVIAIDLLGHGYSSRPENFNYTVEEQAMTLGLFMDAIGVQSAHIMAFSMGSAYALRFALDNPERVGKMMLIAPGGISPEMPLPIKLMDSSLFGGVASMLYGMRTVEKVLSECYFDLAQMMSPEVVGEYYKTISDRESRWALRASFHNFDDESVVSRLRSLEAPVLMLQGSEDKWRQGDDSELYHTAMPYAGFATMRNAGHLLHEEKAEKVIAAILEYIPAIQPEG